MNKKSLLYILLDLIFLAVFNTVFFVVGGTEHPASVWIAYGFIHFSYIMVLVTPFLVRKNSNAAVFGFALYSVSATYFFIEFVVGLIFVFVKSESYKASLVVQIIIAGVYAIMLIVNMIANENTADSSERHEDEVAYIKRVSSRVKMLVGKSTDRNANKEVERVYDLLHSSPSKSSITVKNEEAEIADKIANLEGAVASNSTSDIIAISNEIVSLVEERNRIMYNKLRKLKRAKRRHSLQALVE